MRPVAPRLTLACCAALVVRAAPAVAQVTRPFPGVTLVRNPSRATAVIDLCAAGVSVRATQYHERRATPGGWAEPRGLEVAVKSTSNAISASTLVVYLVHDAAQAGAPPVDYATNQDGGGSSQMYVRGLGQIVNTGRLVNNHLGIEANGGGAAPSNCVPGYTARFRAQSFPGAAAGAIRLTVGQSALHWIELTNTGTQPWLRNVTRLAPTPRDRPSPVGGAGWISATRVSTVAATVPPGGVFRFSVRFTATRVGDFHQ